MKVARIEVYLCLAYVVFCLNHVFAQSKTCNSLMAPGENPEIHCRQTIFKKLAKFQEICKAKDLAYVCESADDPSCRRWIDRNVCTHKSGILALRVLDRLANKMENPLVNDCVEIFTNDNCNEMLRLNSVICHQLKKTVCNSLKLNEIQISCKKWMSENICPLD